MQVDGSADSRYMTAIVHVRVHLLICSLARELPGTPNTARLCPTFLGTERRGFHSYLNKPDHIQEYVGARHHCESTSYPETLSGMVCLQQEAVLTTSERRQATGIWRQATRGCSRP